MDIAKHNSGSFCTSVLRTSDLQRAANFYSAVIGWTTEAVPGVPSHCLLKFNGKSVGSLLQVGNSPDVWVPHVSVEDIEQASTMAISLGARLVDSVDLSGFARLATLRDPEGAMFGLWQAAPRPGAEVMEEVGSLWWIEVLSKDPPRAV